jgi:hypothetical protein
VPVGAGVTVEFDLAARTNGGIGAGEYLEPTSDVSDERGFVSTALNAGTMPGATETVARVVTDEGAIESRVVAVTIAGSLPSADNLTVASAQLNVPGLCFYNLRAQVVALVYDRFHNPVPQGTIVYFSSRYGGIEAQDTTDASGAARVELISANELPPDGFVEIAAQTANAEGASIADTSLVLFSGCTRLENIAPASFAVGNGGCQSFTFNVWDEHGHPLAAGTRIIVTTTTGVVTGDVDVVLPDTQSGYTAFSFALCDADPDDDDPPRTTAVSIRVTSPNNDASALVRGTVN